MHTVAVIPARGGSKGLPGKNIHPLAGRPLLGWTIMQARAARAVQRVVVSTDDEDIAAVSLLYGAEVVRRPPELSGDTATSESAILHTLDSLLQGGAVDPDAVVFLQATSPLRKPDDIDRAVERFIAEKADSLISVTRADDLTIWEEAETGWQSVNFDWRNRGMRQDRPAQYIENGSIYIFSPRLLRETGNRIGGKLAAYPMEFWQTWEIDTIEEIALIEFFLKSKGLAVPQPVNP
ncbi:MAG: acylneuraminate cytidylyltransferase [Pelodictyon luteolum]|uniref:Acylneuraminate cytidylyltransferase n=1 Tax=Pelodictyon luteolum TaxID=1100 RepID=A0A165M2V1_PELLU|nr:acylneuraminate cytidylyltransferase family protein [Pelodictyon luteolum]KZK74748.1 MAG: acylneuraminate cytidylyltransferase [Pelodictyon luteolum]